MARHCARVLILLPVFFAAGCAATNRPTGTQQPATKRKAARSISPSVFAILPWGSTPGDPELLEGIRDCGFNLAGFVSPDALDAVAQAGLMAFVRTPETHVAGDNLDLPPEEIQRRVVALTQRVGDHPAVFGYYLRDEPPATDYPALARWSQAFRAADPDALPYINLFPNYVPLAAMQSWGLDSYDDYVQSFIDVVDPSFLSYDHYALMDDGALRYGYFQNLETMRAASLEHDLPFWNIVLSNSHFRYAEPSPAGLRFQAYTTLAYGARGISYFTYFLSNTGNYRLAPIDQFRHKTPTWDMLRNVNLQLQALVPTYVTLRSVNVFHHPDVPEECRGIDTSRFVKSVDGGDFVVGEFTGPDNTPFLLVVNKDLHHSCQFTVEPKSPARIVQVNSYSGKRVPWKGENDWLAAGQGMLLVLEPAGE